MKLGKLLLFLVGTYYAMNRGMDIDADQQLTNQLLQANECFKKAKQEICSLGRELMACSSKNYYNNHAITLVPNLLFLAMSQRLDHLNARAEEAILLASSVHNNSNKNLLIKCQAASLLQEIRAFADKGLINVNVNCNDINCYCKKYI